MPGIKSYIPTPPWFWGGIGKYIKMLIYQTVLYILKCENHLSFFHFNYFYCSKYCKRRIKWTSTSEGKWFLGLGSIFFQLLGVFWIYERESLRHETWHNSQQSPFLGCGHGHSTFVLQPLCVCEDLINSSPFSLPPHSRFQYTFISRCSSLESSIFLSKTALNVRSVWKNIPCKAF